MLQGGEVEAGSRCENRAGYYLMLLENRNDTSLRLLNEILWIDSRLA